MHRLTQSFPHPFAKIVPMLNFENFLNFPGFDNTCDLSAVLGILANAACFSPDIQRNAKDVRSKVRNEWGHCNFDHWTDVNFAMCFQVEDNDSFSKTCKSR